MITITPADTTRTAVIDFAVVGAQKAGSTHLAACLAAHPALHVCTDEVPFFEDPYFGNSDRAELAAAVGDAAPGQLRGIHRPEYLLRPEVPGRLASVSPSFKALAVVRDPVSRAVSGWAWYAQFGLVPLLHPNEGLRRLLDGETFPDHPRAGEVLEFGRYGEQVARYHAALGPSRVHVLRSQDLHRPEGVAGAYAFLGVDDTVRPDVMDSRTNEGVYDLRRLRFLRARRHFAWRWASTDTYTYVPRRRRNPIGAGVAAAFVLTDRVLLRRLFGAGTSAIDPDLTARLRAFYDDDLERLAGLTGLDLGGWRR
jgi:hypothetical protein